MWNLSEYQKHSRRLSDYPSWAALIGPRVVLNKDGNFQRPIRFRGPDTDSAVPHELMAIRARLNRTMCSSVSVLAGAPMSNRNHLDAPPAGSYIPVSRVKIS